MCHRRTKVLLSSLVIWQAETRVIYHFKRASLSFLLLQFFLSLSVSATADALRAAFNSIVSLSSAVSIIARLFSRQRLIFWRFWCLSRGQCRGAENKEGGNRDFAGGREGGGGCNGWARYARSPHRKIFHLTNATGQLLTSLCILHRNPHNIMRAHLACVKKRRWGCWRGACSNGLAGMAHGAFAFVYCGINQEFCGKYADLMHFIRRGSLWF